MCTRCNLNFCSTCITIEETDKDDDWYCGQCRELKKLYDGTVYGCIVCKSADNEATLLLCDNEAEGCQNEIHMGCLTPPLKVLPKGDFFCPDCAHCYTKGGETYMGCSVCCSDMFPETLLLCDRPGCETEVHLDCCFPVLDSIPKGDWFCSVSCRETVKLGSTKKSKRKDPPPEHVRDAAVAGKKAARPKKKRKQEIEELGEFKVKMKTTDRLGLPERKSSSRVSRPPIHKQQHNADRMNDTDFDNFLKVTEESKFLREEEIRRKREERAKRKQENKAERRILQIQKEKEKAEELLICGEYMPSRDNALFSLLLNDSRFSSTPLVSTDNKQKLRGEPLFFSKQPSSKNNSYMTYPADYCVGCRNGWNHFCEAVCDFVKYDYDLALVGGTTTSNNAVRIGLKSTENKNVVAMQNLEENILGSIILEKPVKQQTLAVYCEKKKNYDLRDSSNVAVVVRGDATAEKTEMETVSQCVQSMINSIERRAAVDNEKSRAKSSNSNIISRKNTRSRKDASDNGHRSVDDSEIKSLPPVQAFSLRYIPLLIKGMLSFILQLDETLLFSDPVHSKFVDYYAKIKNPICWKDIRTKLETNSETNCYETIQQFEADVRLLCNNAILYNQADSIYCQTARKILAYLEPLVKKALECYDKRIEQNEQRNDFEFREIEEKLSAHYSAKLTSNFVRTLENETAYYNFFAIRRACAASVVPFCGGDVMEVNSKVAEVTNFGSLRVEISEQERMLCDYLKSIVKDKDNLLTLNESGCSRFETSANLLERRRIQKQKDLETIKLLGKEEGELARKAEKRVAVGRDREVGNVDVSEELVQKIARLHGIDVGVQEEEQVNGEAPVMFNFENPSDNKPSPSKVKTLRVLGSSIHGWGLFCTVGYVRGEIVAEYMGEYITNNISDVREEEYARRKLQDYQFRIGENLVLDATINGNYARHINHCCIPNCMAIVVDGDGEKRKIYKRVLIYALTDIAGGDEITYDYQFPIETDLSARIPCHCGHQFCRKFLNYDLPEFKSL